ncbi:MAG: phage baseplate assembly protein V [Zoogloeaceae bacterium]|jgi:phage baseplate assembly protein V|nr:phage baseplate assembly protein V [Zoogloeaceae bacterium]
MPEADALPADMNRRIESLIRIGVVSAVDHAAGKCRVKTGGLETNWLTWRERREGATTDWDPPTIGEECMIFSPSGELAGGIVFPGVPSTAHPPPSHDKNQWKRLFPDGTFILYDHAAHLFQINLGSTVLTLTRGMTCLKTPFFLVDTPLTEFTGEVDIIGNMHTHKNAIVDINNINGANDIAAGVQLDGAGNTNHHQHGVDGVALGGDSVPVKPKFPLKIIKPPEPGEPPS